MSGFNEEDASEDEKEQVCFVKKRKPLDLKPFDLKSCEFSTMSTSDQPSFWHTVPDCNELQTQLPQQPKSWDQKEDLKEGKNDALQPVVRPEEKEQTNDFCKLLPPKVDMHELKEFKKEIIKEVQTKQEQAKEVKKVSARKTQLVDLVKQKPYQERTTVFDHVSARLYVALLQTIDLEFVLSTIPEGADLKRMHSAIKTVAEIASNHKEARKPRKTPNCLDQCKIVRNVGYDVIRFIITLANVFMAMIWIGFILGQLDIFMFQSQNISRLTLGWKGVH